MAITKVKKELEKINNGVSKPHIKYTNVISVLMYSNTHDYFQPAVWKERGLK